MSVQTEVPTIQAIRGAMEQTFEQLSSLLNSLSDPLSAEPDAGGWTVRQLLSHIAGSWQRAPIHSGYILGKSDSVSIVIEDPFWIPEWEGAPLRSFQLSIDAGYHGCKALVASLNPDDLELVSDTRFGEMSLGNWLLLSFGHIGHFHLPQLAAFTST